MHGVLSVLSDFAVAYPIAAVIGFLLLRAMCVIYPPAPGLPLDLAAIGLFGPVLGLLFAEAGIMLGATVAFGVARCSRAAGVSSRRSRLSVLADRVERSIECEDESRQFRWWFVVRLRTNPIFDPLSYAAGLSDAKFYPYFLGSLLGNIPSIALFFLVESYAITAGTLTLIATTTLFGLSIWYVGSRWLVEYDVGSIS